MLQGFARCEPLCLEYFHIPISECLNPVEVIYQTTWRDSDGEGSVTCSHASEILYTSDSRKRALPKQIRGKAWIFHGINTTDADQLDTKSESNEEGLFPILVSLLHAHWTSVVQHGLPAVSAQMRPVWPDTTKFIQSTFVVSL